MLKGPGMSDIYMVGIYLILFTIPQKTETWMDVLLVEGGWLKQYYLRHCAAEEATSLK